MKRTKKVLTLLTAALLSSTAWGYPLVKEETKREGTEYKRYILKRFKPPVCEKLCLLSDRCASWTIVERGKNQMGKPECSLHLAIPEPKESSGSVTGIKPAYLFPHMKILEEWGKYFRVLVCYPLNIPGSREKFGWKERPEELGEAAPPKGARGILYLLPPNEVEPAVVEGEVEVPKEGGKLKIRTAGNINSSYRLVVEVNEEKVYDGEIDGARWRTVEVNLDRWKGQKVKVELLGYPLGWFYNYIFIDEIELPKASGI